jgi:hypothetical protein
LFALGLLLIDAQAAIEVIWNERAEGNYEDPMDTAILSMLDGLRRNVETG